MTPRIIRVFPRRTHATPRDALALAYCGPPDLFAEADEVHVSVTFSWDKPLAELDDNLLACPRRRIAGDAPLLYTEAAQ